ncbi:MAG: peptidoglycan-associated lipoprotein Pal [Nitrospina sp.]|nr:MAG: peptidoglycan-associated lipoprotein Pal [Nitrospina sp.]
MQMQDEVFVAPAAETEPVQEARVLPFEDEKQLQDIHFEYDRDNLDSQTKTILRSNSEWLQQNPNARVEIQGHADERGSNNYNLGLGERRALQTKKYLISLGVDESRLYTISYGEEKPFCFQSNENCWWENRRAHFTVAD